MVLLYFLDLISLLERVFSINIINESRINDYFPLVTPVLFLTFLPLLSSICLLEEVPRCPLQTTNRPCVLFQLH